LVQLREELSKAITKIQLDDSLNEMEIRLDKTLKAELNQIRISFNEEMTKAKTGTKEEIENIQKITLAKYERLLVDFKLQILDSIPTTPEERNKQEAEDLQKTIDLYLEKIFSFEDLNHVVLQKLDEHVDSMITQALEEHSDDQGRGVDFALVSGGAHVISHLTSKTFSQPSSFVVTTLGKLLNYPPVFEPPETALTPGRMRGKCWPMDGNHGYLGVKLSHKIIPKNFTLEHVSASVSLDLSSAPRTFVIKGFQDPYDYSEVPVVLATGTYQIDSTPLQIFFVSESIETVPVSGVQLQVLSNHGNEHFTCIYRFSVHGDIST